MSTTSTTNYAAPSQITVGSLTQTNTYNSFLAPTNETGPNGTSVSLGYDLMARPSSATSHFGATTTTSYADTAVGKMKRTALPHAPGATPGVDHLYL